MDEISSRLLTAIIKSGYSYGELEKLTGIPKSAIQRYATGSVRKIPIDRVCKIADVLGVSAESILGWEQAPEEKADDELAAILEELRSREDMRMLFRLAKGASPDDVRQAVKIIEALRKEE